MDEDGAEEEDTSDFQFLPRSQLPSLHFSRPFPLLILEEGSHSVLFMGKVVTPSKVSMESLFLF